MSTQPLILSVSIISGIIIIIITAKLGVTLAKQLLWVHLILEFSRVYDALKDVF